MLPRARQAASSRTARPAAAAVVLHGQRRFPLSGAVAGRAVVRAGRRARGGLATGRQRGDRIRALAPALAPHRPAQHRRAPEPADAGPGARGDELGVLPRGGPAAAIDGGRDRIPRHRDPGRGRRADPSQHRSLAPDHGGRSCHHLAPHHRSAARLRLRVRQLRAVHALHHARPPDGERRRPGRRRGRPAGEHRPARGGHGHRGGHRDAMGTGRGAARLLAPGVAAGRGRGGRLLLGDPLRDRSAGHGPVAPRDVLVDAGPAAGLRHRHRRDRAAPDPDRPGRGGHHPGRARRRDTPGNRGSSKNSRGNTGNQTG